MCSWLVADINGYHTPDDDLRTDSDFLTNVTRTERFKVLNFGDGTVAHGRDSRYWDKDDRRRDEDYSEDAMEHAKVGDGDGSTAEVHVSTERKNGDKKSSTDKSKSSGTRGVGLYNEAGRNELKTYEAEYEASLKRVGKSEEGHSDKNQILDSDNLGLQDEEIDVDDGYDDGIGLHDAQAEDYADFTSENEDDLDVASMDNAEHKESSDAFDTRTKDQNSVEVEQASTGFSDKDSLVKYQRSNKINSNSRHVSDSHGQSSRRSSSDRRSVSKNKSKRRKFSGKQMHLS